MRVMTAATIHAGSRQPEVLDAEVAAAPVVAGEAGLGNRLQQKGRRAGGVGCMAGFTAIVLAGGGMGNLFRQLRLDIGVTATAERSLWGSQKRGQIAGMGLMACRTLTPGHRGVGGAADGSGDGYLVAPAAEFALPAGQEAWYFGGMRDVACLAVTAFEGCMPGQCLRRGKSPLMAGGAELLAFGAQQAGAAGMGLVAG